MQSKCSVKIAVDFMFKKIFLYGHGNVPFGFQESKGMITNGASKSITFRHFTGQVPHVLITHNLCFM